jgi:2-polyprenyl-3-methyl-5-hydroxy-6-metoxy-1,4-benzoquinol methylase
MQENGAKKVKSQPYHKYVFDLNKRKFIGKFEEMYQNEDKEGYDSWFQDDLTHLGKQISRVVINKYNFKSILDIGCGKGAFTHLLKRKGNSVVGIDISRTAVNKARSRYKNIKFFNLSAEESCKLKQKWDLVVMMEILSYIKRWKKVLRDASKITGYIYLSLYLPNNPIGFIKSFRELKSELKRYFNIEHELLWNKECICFLAKKR